MTDVLPVGGDGDDDPEEREAVMKAIDALPAVLGIKDKGSVNLLADRLRKLDDFEGKAAYAEKLESALAAIQAIEESGAARRGHLG